MDTEPVLHPVAQHLPPIFVRFTVDMAETLLRFFHTYQRDDVVTLQMTKRGLWLVNPHNDSRQFLGQAVLPEAERARLRRARGEFN